MAKAFRDGHHHLDHTPGTPRNCEVCKLALTRNLLAGQADRILAPLDLDVLSGREKRDKLEFLKAVFAPYWSGFDRCFDCSLEFAKSGVPDPAPMVRGPWSIARDLEELGPPLYEAHPDTIARIAKAIDAEIRLDTDYRAHGKAHTELCIEELARIETLQLVRCWLVGARLKL